MPQNIDAFNDAVALIMGTLYERFPKATKIAARDLTNLRYSGAALNSLDQVGMQRFAFEYNDLYEIYQQTAEFLLDEGYIRGKRNEGFAVISGCVLTSKGLAALQRVPKSLASNKTSVGDFLIEVGKDNFKLATREAVVAAVRALLGGG